MRYLKRAIHLDFHTMPKIPDLVPIFISKVSYFFLTFS